MKKQSVLSGFLKLLFFGPCTLIVTASILTEMEKPGRTHLIKFSSFNDLRFTFGLIFLAEWGDRSQLSTIVLATSNDVGGIILGGCLGHVICTSIAVIAGALVGRWISVRIVTIIGGIVFIGFAIATLAIGFEDPSTVEISL